MNKVRSKKSKGFSGRNRKFKRFFRPKAGDLQKKKKKRSSPKLRGIFRPKTGDLKKKTRSSSQNVTKSAVSPPKSLIWISICAPEAPTLFISSGHSPRLGGGHNFRLGGHKHSVGGGHGPGMPPVAPGLATYRYDYWFPEVKTH